MILYSCLGEDKWGQQDTRREAARPGSPWPFQSCLRTGQGVGGGLEEEVGFGPALMGGEGVGKPADGVLGGGPRGLGSDASRLAHTEGFSAQGQHFLG